MLLFRGTNWGDELPPEQMEKLSNDWMAWFERWTKQGKVTSGHPLVREGKIVSGKKGGAISDGPFAESKEAIGGYFYLRNTDLDEALKIARECPGLEFGAEVEVRPVAEQCLMMERALAAKNAKLAVA